MDPPEQQPNVEALVERARAGDQAAIGAIYDRLAGRVYRFALFRVGSRADAEDLMQRIFLKMIESLPRYQPRGVPFEAWFFRLARNTVIDHLRARRRLQPLETIAEVDSTRPGPEESAELAMEFRRLETALEDLTPVQQEVIGYRFMAGLSAREIGLIIGKREGSVRALQFRALQALRRSLTRDSLGADMAEARILPESELES
ncbi:MAG TPA: sigma-70 family RNA polymerase sigma factor [Candidatus Limnocylindria bacterium]|jgi:RNA polymerase sigma-70 factor (ECF subfamily)